MLISSAPAASAESGLNTRVSLFILFDLNGPAK